MSGVIIFQRYQQVADAVGAGIKAQQTRGASLRRSAATAATATSYSEVHALKDQSEAYRRAWYRGVQKAIES